VVKTGQLKQIIYKEHVRAELVKYLSEVKMLGLNWINFIGGKNVGNKLVKLLSEVKMLGLNWLNFYRR